jgi:hypothetical protein
MQHTCHRCGAFVDDGTPFCRNCNAPQIKVAAAQIPALEDVLEPRREPPHSPADFLTPAHPRPIDWRIAFPSIFFVAAPAGLLSLPLNILFFLWTFGAAALSVSAYRKRARTQVTPGMAVRLGLISGVVAYSVFLIIFLIALQRTDFGPTFRQQVHATIERWAATNSDPNAKQVATMLSSPDGMATLAFLFILFSVLGGVAGATVFAPKNRAP